MASSISNTGYIIASALARLSQSAAWKKYFTPEAIALNEAFVRSCADSVTKRAIRALPLGAAIWLMDTFFVAGLVQQYAIRKRFIEEHIRTAIAQGTTQVINLGAGFDTLAIRMAKEYSNVRFFEIDLPGTQRAKRAALPTSALATNCNFVEADLAKTELPVVLSKANGFSPEAPTAVILEGVLMYLAEADVKKLFVTLRQIFRGQLTIIFGALVTPQKQETSNRKMINFLLARGNESAKWSCTSADMPRFLAEQGYALGAWMKYKDMQRMYRSESELKNVPEENENYYIAASNLQKS